MCISHKLASARDLLQLAHAVFDQANPAACELQCGRKTSVWTDGEPQNQYIQDVYV